MGPMMYDYERKFEETKKQIEFIIDTIDEKEELKKRLISFLNKELLIIESMAYQKICKIKMK